MIHEGALALAVAILSPQFLTPDQAFRKIWGETKRPRLARAAGEDEVAMTRAGEMIEGRTKTA